MTSDSYSPVTDQQIRLLHYAVYLGMANSVIWSPIIVAAGVSTLLWLTGWLFFIFFASWLLVRRQQFGLAVHLIGIGFYCGLGYATWKWIGVQVGQHIWFLGIALVLVSTVGWLSRISQAVYAVIGVSLYAVFETDWLTLTPLIELDAKIGEVARVANGISFGAIAVFVSWWARSTNQRLQRDLDSTTSRVDRLVSGLLPLNQQNRFLSDGSVSDALPNAVIVAAEINDFAKATQTLIPSRAVEYQNELLRCFRSVNSEFHLTEVDFSNGVYVAATDNQDADPVHAGARAAKEYRKRLNDLGSQKDESTLATIGIVMGTINFGVLGKKRLRPAWWGNALTEAALLCRAAEPGDIVASDKVKKYLGADWSFEQE